MVKDAVQKLKSEMDSNPNYYIKVVGQFLIDYVNTNNDVAEKILNKEKTIEKSLNAMMNKAKENFKSGRNGVDKKNNCAFFTPEEGFEIVIKYFGIEGTLPVAAPAPKVQPSPELESSNFDIRLEDLL